MALLLLQVPLFMVFADVWSIPVRQQPYTSSNTSSHAIVFPEELPMSRSAPLAPPVDEYGRSRCAKSRQLSFCEQIPGYPAAEIRKLIKFKTEDFEDIFGMKGINSRRTISSNDLSEEPVCTHRQQIYFPQSAKNDKNLWRYVVNDVDYVQAVEAEICEKEGKACAYIHNSLPSGYQSICRQRYSYKRLLAIDPNEKKTYMDSFAFPSCCSCFVKAPSFQERRGPIQT